MFHGLHGDLIVKSPWKMNMELPSPENQACEKDNHSNLHDFGVQKNLLDVFRGPSALADLSPLVLFGSPF